MTYKPKTTVPQHLGRSPSATAPTTATVTVRVTHRRAPRGSPARATIGGPRSRRRTHEGTRRPGARDRRAVCAAPLWPRWHRPSGKNGNVGRSAVRSSCAHQEVGRELTARWAPSDAPSRWCSRSASSPRRRPPGWLQDNAHLSVPRTTGLAADGRAAAGIVYNVSWSSVAHSRPAQASEGHPPLPVGAPTRSSWALAARRARLRRVSALSGSYVPPGADAPASRSGTSPTGAAVPDPRRRAASRRRR